MISLDEPFCLSLSSIVTSACLKSGQGNSTNAVKSDAKQCLALALLKQIKISCYTDYTKCLDHSQIYNNFIYVVV